MSSPPTMDPHGAQLTAHVSATCGAQIKKPWDALKIAQIQSMPSQEDPMWDPYCFSD